MQHGWTCTEILPDRQDGFHTIRGHGDQFQAE
jgi:hypothetical protein